MIQKMAALLIAAASVAAFAQAPANPPVRVRGTVEKLDGQNLVVKSRAGESVRIRLADNFAVMGIQKAGIGDPTSKSQAWSSCSEFTDLSRA